MRILIYGGCHAQVLQALLRKSLVRRAKIDTIINFQIIAEGTPFPEGRLKDYDLFIYSPIVNKDQWNTAGLAEVCKSLKVESISYPWLQWNGYYPGIKKLDVAGRHFWFYESVVEAAKRFNNVSDFIQTVTDPDFMVEHVHESLEDTTARLKEHEAANLTDVRISDFIISNYQTRRLFMTPDHPSLVVYREVLRQLGRLMGKMMWPLIDRHEPHNEEWTPILPGVARALDLRFSTDLCRIADEDPETLRQFLTKIHSTLQRAGQQAER